MWNQKKIELDQKSAVFSLFIQKVATFVDKQSFRIEIP